MDFTPGQRKLLAYWGPIQSSVSARASTADLWAAVRAAAAAEGADLSGVRLTDMNGLRSLAAGQRNSMEAFGAAGPGSVIDAGMIARDLSSRSLADQALAPRYLVRFEHQVLVDGEVQSLWRSSFFDGVLPSTVGDLQQAIGLDAEALAEDYGQSHAGVGAIQISAV